MINNAGKLDCDYNAFEKPGTEATGSSTFPHTLNKPYTTLNTIILLRFCLHKVSTIVKLLV